MVKTWLNKVSLWPGRPAALPDSKRLTVLQGFWRIKEKIVDKRTRKVMLEEDICSCCTVTPVIIIEVCQHKSLYAAWGRALSWKSIAIQKGCQLKLFLCVCAAFVPLVIAFVVVLSRLYVLSFFFIVRLIGGGGYTTSQMDFQQPNVVL